MTHEDSVRKYNEHQKKGEGASVRFIRCSVLCETGWRNLTCYHFCIELSFYIYAIVIRKNTEIMQFCDLLKKTLIYCHDVIY